jgi:uncharacterized membrane protein YfcA
VIIAILGALVGLAVGATGMGSGILSLPLLLVACNLPPVQAVGTALLYASIVKLSVTGWYVWRKQVSYPILLRLLAGGVPGAFAGWYALRVAERAVPTGAVLILLGLTAMISAGTSLLRRRGGSAGRLRMHLLPWLGLPIGSVLGFSSSGAGVLGTLVLLRFTALAPAAIVGTDLAFGIALSVAGGSLHAMSGAWDGRVLLLFSGGGIAGAAAGAWLATRTRVERMRLLILAAAFALGATVLYTGVSTWRK